jgi:broad specificity phosphatase PhoE
MRIYLLRHGETDWNVARRIQGRTDIALNSNGVRQARSWQPYSDRIRLAGVYSSALSRAMETAWLASRRAPCIIEGLNERHYGQWDGRYWNELTGHAPNFDRRWQLPDSSPPNGESRLQMHARVQRAMEPIVASHDDHSKILIVAHGGSGKAILGFANKMSIEDLSIIPALANAALTILSSEGDKWSIAEEVPPTDDLEIEAPEAGTR